MEQAGQVALEISTLGIVLKAPRTTAGLDLLIMGEIGVNVQADTMEIVRKS